MALAMAAGLVFAGCGKKEGLDTSKVEKSFSAAEPAAKAEVEKIVAAVKSSDYAGAVASLQKLASNAKITPDQKQTLNDLLAQVQTALGDAAKKAAGEATKAVDNLQKSLTK